MTRLPANLDELPDDERLAAAALALVTDALGASLSRKKHMLVLQNLVHELAHAKRRYIVYDNVVTFGSRRLVERKDARRDLLRKAAEIGFGAVCSEIDRLPRRP